jgi:hypothetical protein
MTPSEQLEPAEPPVRASASACHRGFRIVATASRRVTGALLVNAELTGGPDRIRRWFCVASEESDLLVACERCIADLCRVIDDLCAAPPEPL